MSFLLSTSHLVVGYQEPLTTPISFSMSRGEIIVITGANGSGKSSLLKTILGELPPVSGRLNWGQPIPRRAVMPQVTEIETNIPIRGYELVKWGCLAGWNIMRPFLWSVERRRIQSALKIMDCESLVKQRFQTLSEGQKQRVILARTLAAGANLLILDEPTSAMDHGHQTQTFLKLKEWTQLTQGGILMVTHATNEIESLATQIIRL